MSNRTRRITRLLAGGVLGLSGLAFAPGTAGAVVDTTAFCANVPAGQSGFTDIAQATTHADNVECAKGGGLTSGQTATTYNPTGNVSRAQMATFIANMIDTANELDAPGGTVIPDLPTVAASADAFTDDETTGGHEDNINRLAQADIIQGQTATTYNPTGDVSRAQMATFIAEALDFLRGGPLTEGADRFTDDENTGGHEANINRLANADIIGGQTATTYNPTGPVSRAQMASFIVQGLADLHADGFITPIPAAAGQAEFASSPAGEQLVQLTPTDTGGSRDFTFNLGSAGKTVDAALFDCGDQGYGPAVVGTTFRDIDGNSAGIPDSEADDEGTTYNGNAAIVSTNGDPQGTTQVDNYTSTTATLTVRVTSTGSDCAFLAVWADGDDDDELDLAAFTPGAATGVRGYRSPTEDFGVAGPVVWHHGEAQNGFDMEDGVLYVNRDANFWVGDSFSAISGDQGDRMNFGRANDRYFLDCFSDPLEINQADFEEFLTPGDDTSDDNASYNRNGPNQFENEDDYPLVPMGFTFQVGDFDAIADTASNDVRFTFNTANPGADIEFYRINQYTSAGAFTTSVDSLAQATTVTVTNLAPGNYLFRGESESECSDDSSETDPVAVTISAPPPGNVAGAPVSSTLSAQDKDSSSTLNIGDVITVTFNELMAAPGAGDMIEVTDTDAAPTVATLTNGVNATFALGAQANQLVITLTAGPTITTVGTTIGVQYPADVTDTSGNVDADEGLEWDLVGSTDVTL